MLKTLQELHELQSDIRSRHFVDEVLPAPDSLFSGQILIGTIPTKRSFENLVSDIVRDYWDYYDDVLFGIGEAALLQGSPFTIINNRILEPMGWLERTTPYGVPWHEADDIEHEMCLVFELLHTFDRDYVGTTYHYHTICVRAVNFND